MGWKGEEDDEQWLGRERNGLERERETDSAFCCCWLAFCAKRWSAEIKTRVCTWSLKNKTAQADCPFRSGGLKQIPAFSHNFDG